MKIILLFVILLFGFVSCAPSKEEKEKQHLQEIKEADENRSQAIDQTDAFIFGTDEKPADTLDPNHK